MPFSFGTKVSLKPKTIIPDLLEQTLYGFTNIESHKDVSNSLYYVAPVDDFTNDNANLVKRQQIFEGTNFIDLYFIGEGETGACASTIQSCISPRCRPLIADPIILDQCCGAACYGSGDPGFCSQCPCSNNEECCGKGIYVTGGRGLPFYVRIDLTNVEFPFPFFLEVTQFTENDPKPELTVRDRSTIVELKSTPEKNTTLARVEFTDSTVVMGGNIGDYREACTGTCIQCTPFNFCNCSPFYGLSLPSQVLTEQDFGIEISTESHGTQTETDGHLETIFYNNFGWQGLTGSTWDKYGTGGTGCTVTEISFAEQQFGFTAGSNLCSVTPGGTAEGRGRILGIAINPTFTPPDDAT